MEVISNTPGAGDTLRAGTDKINRNFAAIAAGKGTDGNLVLQKTAGTGIQVDPANPTYGWRDINGHIIPGERWQTDIPRTDVPDLVEFIGGVVKAYAFDVGDKIDQVAFHVPHDYVPGTDMLLHLHWGHNGTAISGSLVVDYYITYSKGHNQSIFSPEIHIQQTILTPDIVTVPQYRHRQDEFYISKAGGGVALLDSTLFEPDGVLLVALSPSVIPTITGSVNKNEPFIFLLDLHYQSTNIGTKQRAPDFYT